MIKLTRYPQNPILVPDAKIWWKAKAVFNPGVVKDKGKIHLLYRWGYAYSQDGINFQDNRTPVFGPKESNPYERMGCEDPRIVKLGERFFIVYCAASLYPQKTSVSPFATSPAPWRIRTALVATQNFQHFRRYGIIIPHQDSKDGTLFPEKINNQYALLYRVYPNIRLAFSSNLRHWSASQEIIKIRKTKWDNWKIGAGAPPLKTPYGWLLFYHGVDRKKVYRLGIIVLDLQHPERIIYRSKFPIFEPETPYEKQGLVNNVVFTCGAIEMEKEYYIYYGAGDRVIGLATIAKEAVLKEIKRNREK